MKYHKEKTFNRLFMRSYLNTSEFYMVINIDNTMISYSFFLLLIIRSETTKVHTLYFSLKNNICILLQSTATLSNIVIFKYPFDLT